MDIRTSVSAVVLALALATPSLAQQTGSVRDFRLPPDPNATPTPEVQGPVDPEAEVRTTPRVIPTETPAPQPSPTSTVSSPTPAPSPTLTLPSPRPTPTRPAPAENPPPSEPEPAPVAEPSPPPAAATGEPSPLPTEFAPTTAPAASVPTTSEVSGSGDGAPLLAWLAALAAALVLAGGAFWYFRRREAPVPVPVVEPPLVRREAPPPQPDVPAAEPTKPQTAPAPPLPQTTRAPVTLNAQPVRLSKSMMNATFAFRLVLENQSVERWEDVAVEADLVTAHGAVPIAEQVADPAGTLAPLTTLESLEPGDAEVAGEVRLPLSQVRAIPQGRAAVYVPLLRVRLTAKGKQPIARTFLIGQLPDRPGGRLRPFRLDEMPQSYNAIGLRPLD